MRARLGQNFLIDRNISRKIISSAEILPSETVIEIGPGKGILTEGIAKFAKNVIAVEIDRSLAENLSKKFVDNRKIRIIKNNFLEWTPDKKNKMKFVANLPYNVSTSIIEKILYLNNWEIAVFMVQKEVANRIRATAGSDDYSSLSILCQVFCKVEKLFDVPKTCFIPIPKITSTVLKFKRLDKALVNKKNQKIFFEIVRASFKHRRKIF